MTLQSESFTGADSASLAAADVDLSWSDVVSGWSVAANRAAIAAADAVVYSRAEADVGGADMFAEATLTGFEDLADGFQQFAVLARYSPSANTCYMVCRGSDTPNDIRIRMTSAGSRSTLASTTVTLSLPEVIRIEVEGSTIRALIDDVEVLSVVNTAITTGQRGGLYGYRPSGGTVEADDFTTGLLSDTAGTTGALAAVLPGMTAAFTGGSVSPGALVGALPALAGEFTGASIDSGVLMGALPALSASLAGQVVDAGALAATLPGLAATFTGDTTVSGQLEAALPALVGQFQGGQGSTSGELAAALPALVAAFTGASATSGVLAAVLPALAAQFAVTPPRGEIQPGTRAAPSARPVERAAATMRAGA